jgi:hypothetical protein
MNSYYISRTQQHKKRTMELTKLDYEKIQDEVRKAFFSSEYGTNHVNVLTKVSGIQFDLRYDITFDYNRSSSCTTFFILTLDKGSLCSTDEGDTRIVDDNTLHKELALFNINFKLC